MKHSVGQNRIILSTAIFVLFFGRLATAGTYAEKCIGNNLLLTNITPTIQTIASLLSNNEGGKVSLIRGKLEFIHSDDKFIAGYLSTRFFEEDGLIGLEGVHDKEGFFIIRKDDYHVDSGLSGKSFFYKLENQYHQKGFDFLTPENVKESGDCSKRE